MELIAEIENLSSLEELWLSNNNINELSLDLEKLNNLNFLELDKSVKIPKHLEPLLA